MITRHVLDALAHARRELGLWSPADGHARRISEILGELTEHLGEEAGRMARELEARIEEKRQLEIALCFTDDAVCVTNARGEIRLFNPAFERLAGLAGEDNIGSPVYALWKPVPAETVEQMKSAAMSGKTWRGRLRIDSHAGRESIVEATVEPIIDHGGSISNLVITQRDITARVKAERDLSFQKELLEKIINLSSNVVAVLGPDGKWSLDNLAAKTLFADLGPGGRETLAGTLLGLLTREPAAKRRKVTLNLAGGAAAHYFVQTEKIPGGYLFPASSGTSLFLVTMSDITEIEVKNREILARKQAMASLRQEKILAHDELANGFVYKISQPLNVARAIARRMQTLISENNEEGLTNNLALLQEMIEAMEKGMKEFRRISSAAGEDIPGCDVGELLEFVDIIYRNRAKEAGVALGIGNGRGGAVIPAPDDAMRMAVSMLLDNALDSVAGSEKKEIRLRSEATEDGISITVEDSGPGVAEEDRIRIFEPFFTTRAGRQGLSLALVNHAVRKAGGSVDVGTSPLGGAAFSLAFPVRAEP